MHVYFVCFFFLQQQTIIITFDSFFQMFFLHAKFWYFVVVVIIKIVPVCDDFGCGDFVVCLCFFVLTIIKNIKSNDICFRCWKKKIHPKGSIFHWNWLLARSLNRPIVLLVRWLVGRSVGWSDICIWILLNLIFNLNFGIKNGRERHSHNMMYWWPLRTNRESTWMLVKQTMCCNHLESRVSFHVHVMRSMVCFVDATRNV